MSEFRDEQMEQFFGAAGGPSPDLDVAYDRVTGSVRTVRRRRAALAGGALCTLLIGAAALTVARQAGSQRIQPGSELSTPLEGSRNTASSTTPVTTSGTTSRTTTTPPSTATTTVAAASTLPPTTSVQGAVEPRRDTSVPATNHVDTPAVTTAPDNTRPSSPPITQTFSGVGGRITVRLENDSLLLINFVATDGFAAEVDHADGSHVEVHFTNATHETNARVDLENGQMVQRFEETND